MSRNPDRGHGISEADLLAHYGDNMIKMGDRAITLSTAIQMEAAFCTADTDKRQDPVARLSYLARKIGHETLLPEHQHLLNLSDNPEA